MCRDGIQNGVRKPALGFGLVRFGHFTIRSRKDVEADGREETEEENREAGGTRITKKMVASKPERERERERKGGKGFLGREKKGTAKQHGYYLPLKRGTI